MKKLMNCLAIPRNGLIKTWRIMRLTFLIVLLGLLQVSAKSYSQQTKFSMNFENMTLEDAFRKIEDQTNYIFFYNADQIDLDQLVNLNVENEDIEDLLGELLNEDEISYKVTDRRIVLYQQSTVGQQSHPVKGKVVDDTGFPLPGVSVVVKETTNGTITNFDGEYQLDAVPANAVLSFSFIGMKTQEVLVGDQEVINVTLAEETIGLEEVVAIGYGIQKKSDLTGASSRLTSDDMDKSVATSPVEMMQGRVSGVNITQNSGEPGTGMSVRIRGSNSIRSGQEPLYVVDGVPLDNTDITPEGGGAAGYGGGSNKNPLSFLNPEDIETIDILKDASSTAIYGSRGANGVVLITTKKGKKGEGTLSYDGYVGVSQIREKLDLLSASEFRSFTKSDGSKLLDLGASTDWQDEIYQAGITQSHNLSFGGGSDKFTYQTSLGYLNQEGIIKSTAMEKINGSIKVTHKAFDDRLNLTGVLIASHVEDTRAPITEAEGSGFEGDLILSALQLNPTFPVKNEDGTYYQHSTEKRNPVAMLNLVDDITQTDRILANISADFKITNNLTYKINVGLDRTVAERRVNQNQDLSYLSNKGEADINGVSATNRLIENYITYLRDIGDDHSFNFLLGHAYQGFKGTTTEMNVKGFEVDDLKYTDNLGYGNFSQAEVGSSAYERELQSFFGRINYSYKSKYLLTFTGRADGSSKFGENNKYGFFPSAAFAWRVIEEDFMASAGAISNLKFRVGWGLTGNQEIPDKISLLSVGTEANANWFVGGSFLPGITFTRTPNPDIQWETTQQTNIGIDYGFFNNRLSGAIDFFNKKTVDVLLEVPAKAPAPTQTQWLNVPDMKIINNGVELAINGVLVSKKDLTWDMGINLAYIKNEVKDLPVKFIETGSAAGQGLTGTRVQVITNGEPVGTFYGMVFEGFDSDGYSTYKTDAEGSEVKEYLGSALPDFTYSLSSKLTYKNFDVSMFWYGSEGNEIYNNTANAIYTKGPFTKGNNVTKTVAESNENPGNSNAFSSRFIEDASFLRLSNLTLGYTLKTTTIEWLDRARVYVTGNNLLLFTKYTGYDPEVNSDANVDGIPSLGIDYTSYPKPTTVTFGVNLQF
ncbi:TonB-dependent receptor [Sunxiuqinia indica]|uniref:TonB-dependent receptor n=1 Tax=Sunxiuqinia indica TaxID=2692584 RepID=UPI001358282B|nr:TonB-dependent receptor [Sunxiuqinia indica]